MLRRSPPMSNSQRQRAFRDRNPDYYRELHAKRRAEARAGVMAMQMETAINIAIEETQTVKEPLALPAPAITFEFPGINAWPTRESIERQKVAVRVR